MKTGGPTFGQGTSKPNKARGVARRRTVREHTQHRVSEPHFPLHIARAMTGALWQHSMLWSLVSGVTAGLAARGLGQQLEGMVPPDTLYQLNEALQQLTETVCKFTEKQSDTVQE